MENNQAMQDVEKKIRSIENQLKGHLTFSEKVELKARMLSLIKWLDAQTEDFKEHSSTLELLIDTMEQNLNNSKKA